MSSMLTCCPFGPAAPLRSTPSLLLHPSVDLLQGFAQRRSKSCDNGEECVRAESLGGRGANNPGGRGGALVFAVPTANRDRSCARCISRTRHLDLSRH